MNNKFRCKFDCLSITKPSPSNLYMLQCSLDLSRLNKKYYKGQKKVWFINFLRNTEIEMLNFPGNI